MLSVGRFVLGRPAQGGERGWRAGNMDTVLGRGRQEVVQEVDQDMERVGPAWVTKPGS